MTKKGGCSKIKKMFCYCYDTTLTMLHIPNDNFCDNCESILILRPECRDEWKCYCKRMSSNEYYEIVLNEYTNFKEQVNTDV